MNNNISQVLDDTGIIYTTLNLEQEEKNEDRQINTYFIKLLIQNNVISGGIKEDDKMVTVLFFDNIAEYEEKIGCLQVLEIINELNQTCKFGNFTYEDKDITYSLFIPKVETNEISKAVFKYYFEYCLSTVKDSFEEVFCELRKNDK